MFNYTLVEEEIASIGLKKRPNLATKRDEKSRVTRTKVSKNN